MVPQKIDPGYHSLPLTRRVAVLSAEIRDLFPDLSVRIVDGYLMIHGSLSIAHEERVLDRYQIEIRLSDDFPNSEPEVREIGGRIPHLPDRHVNPNNGTLCWQVPEEWLLEGDRTLLGFLQGPLRNFLLGNSLHELGDPFPFGERAHGLAGLIQSYGSFFGTSDQDSILRYLDCLSHDTIRGHWDCPCGSGSRLRRCHREQLFSLKGRIPPRVAKRAARRFREQIALVEKGKIPFSH